MCYKTRTFSRAKDSMTEVAPRYPSGWVLHYDGGLADRSPATVEAVVEPFRILEHPADVGFEAWGAKREDVFTNAARALFHLIVEPDSVVPRAEVSVRVEGREPADLLVNWLSEILYLHDAEGWLFRDFELHALGDTSLAAVARGEKIDRERHQLKLLVKAITYHQLALEETPEGWRAQVYVDI